MKGVSDLFGVSQLDAQRLQHCGIRTVHDLSAVRDLNHLAADSGVPADQLREWQQLCGRDEQAGHFRRTVTLLGLLVVSLGVLALSRTTPLSGVPAGVEGDIYDTAYRAYQNDSIRQAARLLDSAMLAGREGADVRNLRGLLYASIGDTNSALQEYRKALELNDKYPYALNNLGTVHLARGDSVGAIAMFARAAEHDSSASRFAMLGYLESTRGHFVAAANAYGTAAKLAPDSVTYWRGAARSYRRTRNWDAAIEANRAIARLDSTDWNARFYVAWCLRQKGDSVSRAVAVREFKALLKANPQERRNRWAYVNLAIEYASTPGDEALHNAEHALTQALEVDSTFAEAFVQWGYLLEARRQFARAREMYGRALAVDSANTLAHYNLILSYSRAGRRAEAESMEAQLVRRAPRDKYTLLLAAEKALVREDYNAIVRAYQDGLREYPGDPDFSVQLALAELHAGDMQGDARLMRGGLGRLEQAVAKDSTNDDAYFALGYAYQAMARIRDIGKAEYFYDKKLLFDPRNLRTLLNLAPIKLERGDVDGAIQLSRRALDIRMNDAEALENIGYAFAVKGDLPTAIAWYDSALKYQNGSPVTAYLLRGQALLNQGDPAQAHEQIALARTNLDRHERSEAGSTWTMLLLGRYDPSGKSRMVYYGTRAQKQAAIDLTNGVVYVSASDTIAARRAFGSATARLRHNNPNDAEVVRMALAYLRQLEERSSGRASDAIPQAVQQLRSWLATGSD